MYVTQHKELLQILRPMDKVHKLELQQDQIEIQMGKKGNL